jgi:hypothetical protein
LPQMDALMVTRGLRRPVQGRVEFFPEAFTFPRHTFSLECYFNLQ